MQAQVTLGLVSNQTGDVLATITQGGGLSLFSVYQPENDIPEQRLALEVLYNTTAGQNWTAGAYFSTAFIEFVEEFEYEVGNYTGKAMRQTRYCQLP